MTRVDRMPPLDPALVGYFTTVSMVMNVAHTPVPKDDSVTALRSFPL